jgi:hypothetical protein
LEHRLPSLQLRHCFQALHRTSVGLRLRASWMVAHSDRHMLIC